MMEQARLVFLAVPSTLWRVCKPGNNGSPTPMIINVVSDNDSQLRLYAGKCPRWSLLHSLVSRVSLLLQLAGFILSGSCEFTST